MASWGRGASRRGYERGDFSFVRASRPYVNLIVYHGVLAPNAKWRREVVVFGRAQVEREPSSCSRTNATASYNRTWAKLMRRGLDIDVLQCTECDDRLRFVAAIMRNDATRLLA